MRRTSLRAGVLVAVTFGMCLLMSSDDEPETAFDGLDRYIGVVAVERRTSPPVELGVAMRYAVAPPDFGADGPSADGYDGRSAPVIAVDSSLRC